MRAHLPIGIEMVYNCVIVGITLKRGVSKMGQIKGGFLRCGSAIASSIALMSASAVFAQESGSATSEARAEPDIIVTGTRVRRSEEHTSELQSLMRISDAVIGLTTKHNNK